MQTNHFSCVCISIVRLHCRKEIFSQVKWSPSLDSCKTYWHKCVTTCFVGLKREISVAISAISTEVAEGSLSMPSILSKCKVTWTRKVTFTAKKLYNSQERVRCIAAIQFNLWSKTFRTRFLLQVKMTLRNLNLTELKSRTAYFYS